MAIKTALTYNQIGKNLQIFIQPVDKQDIPYVFLSCIGVSSTLIKRYKEGKNTITSFDGLLIKKILAFRLVTTDRMKDELELLKTDEKVQKNQPPILAVSDGVAILANLFMSKLLFCFFAEDTGIFKKDLFTSSCE